LGGAEEDNGAGQKPAPFLFSARSDIKVGLALPPPKLPQERAQRCSCAAYPDVVPPASLRWLAVKFGQTGRFALPSFGVCAKVRPCFRGYVQAHKPA